MAYIPGHSNVPLRWGTQRNFALAVLSLLTAILYGIYELRFWMNFEVGQAPMVFGVFLFSSVHLFFIGLVGDNIGAIHTQVLHRPVLEQERINF